MLSRVLTLSLALLCRTRCEDMTPATSAFVDMIVGASDMSYWPVRAPEARSPEEAAHRQAVETALRATYRHRSGFCTDSSAASEAATPVAPRHTTYGEVTPVGARQLAGALGLLNGTREAHVFADLGSGTGKLVVQAFLEWPSVARAVGIELADCRAHLAGAAWQALQNGSSAASLRRAALGLAGKPSRPESDGAVTSGLTLVHGDLFAQDLSDISVAFISSLYFDEAMLTRLAAKLSAEARALVAFASLRHLQAEVDAGVLVGFELSEVLSVEMSWSRASTAWVYRRRTAPAQPTAPS